MTISKGRTGNLVDSEIRGKFQTVEHVTFGLLAGKFMEKP
jgi:hypothetical protein